MVSRHKPRRPHISGTEGVRARVRRIARKRTHRNFTQLLSGYDQDGDALGPYSGTRILDYDHERHAANGDETRADFAGSYSKGLEHDGTTGFVVPANYNNFREALIKVVNAARLDPTLPDPASVEAFDEVTRPGTNERPFTNPLSGVGTDIDGTDPLDLAIDCAPSFSSDIAAAEMVELYWMALLRDAWFEKWEIAASPEKALADAAVTELNNLNQNLTKPFALHYARPADWSRDITVKRLFRGSAPGNDVGPYISQFLIWDVPFGTLDFEQKQLLLLSKQDYMINAADWLAVQGGGPHTGFSAMPIRSDLEEIRKDGSGNPLPLPQQKRRHIVTLRDLAHYVHFDALHQAYFNAALILNGVQGAPLSVTNVYERPARQKTQEGFGTFGGPHILVLLTEVATRALKAVWHQKWYVHRRLRPEALGRRVHLAKTDAAYANLVDTAVLNSTALQETYRKTNSYLLPMAFPEGSPMHPSYGAGHATVAGACVTILKAMFDPQYELPHIFEAVDDGSGQQTELVKRANSESLTVGGELNKLAANIAIGRNAAGVHYRSDYTKSLALGEAVAVALLQELTHTFVEAEAGTPVWSLPTFDGHWIAINAQGKISRLRDAPPKSTVPRRRASLFTS
ncbi:vanadium-dependent haloperoxidase [Sinorhizobium meliloti]|uniref:vanadium-dependent haloperoxidase n=1 Tax=Rhizobium meliloti TaxID=382 RepID=UPI0018659492|nr:vanadium-dependent haloperoxidase [Sinorhizobium meliloti]